MPPRNDSLLRALRREATDHAPIWLMRQAGRYLPEYNATRARAGSFMSLCRSPEFATEVTLQPLARYPLDAAILFSDILTVPDAMGLGLSFAEGEGPRFERPLADEAAIARLEAPDLSRLQYVFDAVAAIKRALEGSVPLLGFAGSPFTLACYMIDGGASSDFGRTRRLLYARPDLLDRVLAINATAVAAYLAEQVRHGADAVMIFDTWGGLLAADAYARFSLAYIERVLAALHATCGAVPTIVFTKGGGQWLERIAALRLRRGRDRLDDRHRRCARAHRRAGGRAGQSRSPGAANDPAGNRESGARGIACRGPATRAYLQPRPRHPAANSARACRCPCCFRARRVTRATAGSCVGPLEAESAENRAALGFPRA